MRLRDVKWHQMTSPKLWTKTRAHRVFRPFGRFLGTWADSTHSTAAEVEGFGSWRFRIQDFGVLIAVLPQKLDDDLLAEDGHLMPFDVICGVICVRHFKRANHSKPSYKTIQLPWFAEGKNSEEIPLHPPNGLLSIETEDFDLLVDSAVVMVLFFGGCHKWRNNCTKLFWKVVINEELLPVRMCRTCPH